MPAREPNCEVILPPVLCTNCAWGASIGVMRVVIVPLPHATTEIDSVPTIVVLVVDIKWRIPNVARVVRVAGCEVSLSIYRRVVVAEVEMVAVWAHEQMQKY